jgi:hypothetical protein
MSSETIVPTNGPAITDGGSSNRLEAVEKVIKLCNLPLPCDSHPNIHAALHAIKYHVDVNAGFCDRFAFSFGVAKYLEEAGGQAEMVTILSWILHFFSCKKYCLQLDNNVFSSELNGRKFVCYWFSRKTCSMAAGIIAA